MTTAPPDEAAISEAPEERVISGRRKILELIGLVLISMVVIGALSAIALLIYTDGAREPTVHVIDIAPGSWDLIQAGENPLEIPPTWAFYADDTLVLDNRDDVAHTLGNWYVPPHTTRAFDLQPAYGGFFSCSLHPSGGITLDIQPRDFDISLITYTTLGFGLSVGLILWIGLNVARAMDHDEDEWMHLAHTGAPADGPTPDNLED